MSDLFGNNVLSVSDLTTLLKSTLEGAFYGLNLEGEISNFHPAASGHWYFQLNDEQAAIQAVMFKPKTWRLGFIPKDGDVVTVTGAISLYEKRGTYQIVCDTMAKSGVGNILAMLEERKRSFAEAGYFDASLKRPLPEHPRRVGVVTSPTGAALQDILQVLQRRNCGIDIVVLPTPVQGEEAALIIAAQIRAASRLHIADVLIIGRGGGSLEDLLPFSEQCVIEAIVASEIPIISAVGHEIDWTLSDFAADLRAPTPSAAAELVSDSLSDQLEKVRTLKQEMAGSLARRLESVRSQTRQFSVRIMGDYLNRCIEHARLEFDDCQNQFTSAMQQLLLKRRHTVDMLTKELGSLSPLSILDRGYAIVTHIGTAPVLSDVSAVQRGDSIGVRLAKGRLEATVDQVISDVKNKTDDSRRKI